MPTLTIDEPTAAALRRYQGGVDLLDAEGTPLGRFLPAKPSEADIRREWVGRMATEFPSDELDRIEAEPTRTMADVLALVEERE